MDPSAPASGGGGGWKVLFIVFFLAVGMLGALAWWAASWKKEVLVQRVVVDGASLPSVRALEGQFPDIVGTPLLQADTAMIGKTASRLAYVQDASVAAELNGLLRIRVVERVPIAVAQVDGEPMMIDRTGLLLPPEPGFQAPPPGLVRVFGIGGGQGRLHAGSRLSKEDFLLVRLFLDALLASPHAALLVRELHIEPGNGSWLQAAGTPTRFLVGNGGDFKEKLKKFEIFWQKVVTKTGLDRYERVDLRFRKRVFATPSAQQAVSPDSPL